MPSETIRRRRRWAWTLLAIAFVTFMAGVMVGNAIPLLVGVLAASVATQLFDPPRGPQRSTVERRP